MVGFGEYVRQRREALQKSDGGRFSLRQVAVRVGVQPGYLSRVERGLEARPSEETTVKLADELSLDRDLLLAMAGKVSADLRETICKRPTLFASLIRQLKDLPDHAVLRVVREIRDGQW